MSLSDELLVSAVVTVAARYRLSLVRVVGVEREGDAVHVLAVGRQRLDASYVTISFTSVADESI